MTHQRHFPRVGLLYRETRAAMPLLELAHAAEERGFDCVIVGEHTHIPVSRESPWPAGGDLPAEYYEFPDPYVALAFVAAQTRLADRHRCRPRRPARSDRAGQDHRHARPPLRRPIHPRCGVRLEPRGTRQPREGLHASPGHRARARRADAGAVDRDGGRVPRRAREPRAELGLAQAGAAHGPGAPRRASRRARLRSRRRVGGRMDPGREPREVARGQARRAPPTVGGRRSRPRPARSSGPCRRWSTTTGWPSSSTASRSSRSIRSFSTYPPRLATRSCRSSIATRR